MKADTSEDGPGFELVSLPRLFEVKSTVSKEKSAYQIIMKQYVLRKDPDLSQKLLKGKDYFSFWKRVPSQIFEDTLVTLAKGLS